MIINLELLLKKINEPDLYLESKLIDQELGIDCYPIELEIVEKYGRGKNKNWIGLDEQTLQTPYRELNDIFRKLSKWNWIKIVDLGAAYGRVGIVAKFYNPDIEFLGFENIQERVDYGNEILNKLDTKLKLQNKSVLEIDFSELRADIFFIYDFSDIFSIEDVLIKLEQKFEKGEKFFLVARGKGVRSLILNKFRSFFALYGVIHGENWSIFSTFTDLEG